MKKRLVCDFELKEFNQEEMTFSGYASNFKNIDYGGDVVSPGAFKLSLERRKTLKAYWSHGQNRKELPLGKTIEAKEDDRGLFVKVKISATIMGKDVHTLLQDKVLDKMSFGYEIIKDRWEKGIHYLDELDIWEVSIVDFPMNDKAEIVSVKSDKSLDFETNLELIELEDRPFAMIKSLMQAMDEAFSAKELDAIPAAIAAYNAAMVNWINQVREMGLDVNVRFISHIRYDLPYYGSSVIDEEDMMKSIKSIQAAICNILEK